MYSPSEGYRTYQKHFGNVPVGVTHVVPMELMPSTMERKKFEHEVKHLLADKITHELLKSEYFKFNVQKRQEPHGMSYEYVFQAEIHVADLKHSQTMVDVTDFMIGEEKFHERDIIHALKQTFPERLV